MVEQDEFAAQTVEIEQLEPEVFDPDSAAAAPERELPPEFEPDPADDDEEEARPRSGWQRLVSLIVPIAVVVYILITALADRS